MKMRRSALPLLLLLAAGCARGGQPGAPDSPAASPVTVTVLRVTRGTAVADRVLTGRVKARREVTVLAGIGGRVTALPRAEGERFRAGEALAVFEAPESRQALSAARAAQAAAALRLDQARLQESRMDSLYAARVAALRELELAQSERRGAEATDAAARAAAQELEAAVRASVPFAGVVVRHRVDAGAPVTPGQPLLDVRSQEPGEVAVAVPESELEVLAGARLRLQQGDGPWLPATLARVEGMTDPATRTRTAFLRPTDASRRLEPGAFARVRMESAPAARAHGGRGGDQTSRDRNVPSRAPAELALELPSTSLVRRGGLTGVFVAAEGRARLRWLRVGSARGDQTEVLSGLRPGDLVILSPGGLSDGRAVRVAS